MRRTLGVVFVGIMLLASCGDDDGGDDVALAPIEGIDPCELLDEQTASDLAGGEVERVDGDDGSCQYNFAENVGEGLAAAMQFEEGSEDALPTGDDVEAIDTGDSGAVKRSDENVEVVYVVQEIVVRIEIVPVSGTVDDQLVDKVVGFAEETEAPVVEAVTGEAPEVDPASLWRLNAIEHRDAVGEQFEFECPLPSAEGTVWGDNPYTDDSSVCTAAVHAGEITLEDGGTVLIQMVEGQDSFPGTDANGIESFDWGSWPGAFLVLEGD